MSFSREKAKKFFDDYAENYDAKNFLVFHKIKHTYNVAELSARIANSIDADENLAWVLGLLHDFGRFEQIKQYGTFIDAISTDHAELGADILFCGDELIKNFPAEDLPKDWREISEKAIRLHNKLFLPEDLSPRTRIFCEILRDADKLDIFRILAEVPPEKRIWNSKAKLSHSKTASPEVMNCVYSHKCVDRRLIKSEIDAHISHCCMAFEIVYPESRKILKEQGYLKKILHENDSEQIQILQTEIEKAL